MDFFWYWSLHFFRRVWYLFLSFEWVYLCMRWIPTYNKFLYFSIFEHAGLELVLCRWIWMFFLVCYWKEGGCYVQWSWALLSSSLPSPFPFFLAAVSIWMRAEGMIYRCASKLFDMGFLLLNWVQKMSWIYYFPNCLGLPICDTGHVYGT